MAAMTVERGGTSSPSIPCKYQLLTLKSSGHQGVRRYGSTSHGPRRRGTTALTRTDNGTLKGIGRIPPDQPLPYARNETSVQPEEAALENLTGESELSAVLAAMTDVSVTELVERVTARRNMGTMSAGEAADLLFPFLFDGSLCDRRMVYATLLAVAAPEAVMDTALRTYRHQRYESYLNEAASLLADFGHSAWSALRRWIRRGGAECESIVETAFSIEGVPDAERMAGLKDLIRLGDHNTRFRALGAFHLLPAGLRKPFLEAMAESADVDDPSRAEAAERLAEEPM